MAQPQLFAAYSSLIARAEMATQVIVRPALRLPEWNSAGNTFKRVADRLQAQADRLAQSAAVFLAPSALLQECKERWSARAYDLQHPLSAKWIQRHPANACRTPRNSLAEYHAFTTAEPHLKTALMGTDFELTNRAYEAAGAITCGGLRCPIRTTQASLAQDSHDVAVLFGAPDTIPMRLALLGGQLAGAEMPPALEAVCALASFLNIHPFEDGNGRCARALFNTVLRLRMNVSGLYIPLRIALELSQGGFELRLREVEAHGNWFPLIQYFTALLGCLAHASTSTQPLAIEVSDRIFPEH